MKALTLLQPWASLIALGAKRFETRSWPTDHHGLLAIHASKRWHREVLEAFGASRASDWRHFPEWEAICAALVAGGYTRLAELPTGAVLCVTRLTGCFATPYPGARRVDYPGAAVTLPPDPPESHFGDYSPGRYAWRLAPVLTLPAPIPTRGHQGLWDWTPPEDLAAQLRDLYPDERT